MPLTTSLKHTGTKIRQGFGQCLGKGRPPPIEGDEEDEAYTKKDPKEEEVRKEASPKEVDAVNGDEGVVLEDAVKEDDLPMEPVDVPVPSPSAPERKNRHTKSPSTSRGATVQDDAPPPPRKLPPVYAHVDKLKMSSSPASSPQRPTRAGFLVSFLVDARGGAMTGCRGSGLRLILPPGAVDHPTRVTCRYVRNLTRLAYPPPLMEREALASRVIEVGPHCVSFHAPVLIEVPHFASLRGGERELILLRSDDGETWREHTQVYYHQGWSGGTEEEAIYEEVVASTGLERVYDDLATKRIVRISTRCFPRYFALLSRIREEIRAIGADGGSVVCSTAIPRGLQAKFPAGALQKKIKVALQVQSVPTRLIKCTFPDGDVLFSPLVAIEPRRRRFHQPVQLCVPIHGLAEANVPKVRLFCSLAGGTSTAKWEDLSSAAPVAVRDENVIFQTKVSALFWLVACKNDRDDLLEMTTRLYEEIILPPYMARFVVFFRPHFPHAWCDTLKVFCVTDDKAEKSLEHRDEEWILVAESEELEVPESTPLRLTIDGNLEIANECQLEAGLAGSLRFFAFRENSATLLIRSKDKSAAQKGQLSVTKNLSHLKADAQKPLCKLEINLEKSGSSVHASMPDLAPVHNSRFIASLVGHVVEWSPLDPTGGMAEITQDENPYEIIDEPTVKEDVRRVEETMMSMENGNVTVTKKTIEIIDNDMIQVTKEERIENGENTENEKQVKEANEGLIEVTLAVKEVEEESKDHPSQENKKESEVTEEKNEEVVADEVKVEHVERTESNTKEEILTLEEGEKTAEEIVLGEKTVIVGDERKDAINVEEDQTNEIIVEEAKVDNVDNKDIPTEEKPLTEEKDGETCEKDEINIESVKESETVLLEESLENMDKDVAQSDAVVAETTVKSDENVDITMVDRHKNEIIPETEPKEQTIDEQIEESIRAIEKNSRDLDEMNNTPNDEPRETPSDLSMDGLASDQFQSFVTHRVLQ